MILGLFLLVGLVLGIQVWQVLSAKALAAVESPVLGKVQELERGLERFERGLKEDLFRSLQSITAMTESNERRFDVLRETLEKRLTLLQDDNNKKLELIRVTVDEKLHETLEKRLGESFKLVGDRLELVHKGLGEMQSLAIGVGDLKKVLSNVKTRGMRFNWGTCWIR